ncbi:hypothetical protein ABZU32_23975 [Sphaerisporangium sp. NPDC005288]|uniref:Uncharacterized protein n=1 Tax=Sphaerisporangium rhizosphaerae TaxID=2269375 RepID=A0ABW2P009_9ACTN
MTHGSTKSTRSAETRILRDSLTLPIRMSITWNAPRSPKELAFADAEQH